MLTLATWNIHRCIGRDGRYAPRRIRAVLRRLDADVMALQEVELFHNDPELLDFLRDGSDWQALAGITLERKSGRYGNALLTRLPALWVQRIDISRPGREPRGALQAVLRHENGNLGVVATHLGLRPGERRWQLGRLLPALRREPAHWNGLEIDTVALLGDLNEWLPGSRMLRGLRQRFGYLPGHRTWPSNNPRLALDRILLDPEEKLLTLQAVENERTRIASDHLPLLARIDG